jgi:hypothetical protein
MFGFYIEEFFLNGEGNMAANAEKMVYIDLPFEQVYLVLGTALTNMGAKIKSADQTSGVLTASRGASLSSWGETITISPYRTPRGCSLKIKSECSLPTQIFDWGKNSENINRFAIELSSLLQVPIY